MVGIYLPVSSLYNHIIKKKKCKKSREEKNRSEGSVDIIQKQYYIPGMYFIEHAVSLRK